MLRTSLLLALFLAVSGLPYQPSGFKTTALDDYVNMPDDHYSWTDTGLFYEHPTNTVYFLNMTSQKWLTEAETNHPIWWHIIAVVVPKEIEHYDNAVLYITGDNNNVDRIPDAKSQDVMLATELAVATRCVGASLFQIPNQPIYFNDEVDVRRTEDSFIAKTWSNFAKNTSQPEWLARLPMTKAVVRAMDTIQAFVHQKLAAKTTGFVIAGASKRGWTTWTTAAVDTRVIACIPIVMDMLNFVENVHHMFRAYGGWTFAFEDYYAINFTKELDSPEVAAMAGIIDPLVYADRLTMPKLVISTGGDEFFMPDDSHYWFNKLKGETHFLLVKDAEHSLATGLLIVLPAVQAFLHSVLAGTERPHFTWTIEDDGTIVVTSPTKPRKINVVHADTVTDKRRDWRLAVGSVSCHLPDFPVSDICIQPVLWHSKTVASNEEGVYRVNAGLPKKGWRAFFVELEFDGPGIVPFRFTTEASILPNTFPFPDCHGEECLGTLV